jgi:hypothetical protein
MKPDLRTMLRERAHDVVAVPPGLLDPPSVIDAPSHVRPPRGWRWAGALAAAAAIVAGAIGLAVTQNDRGDGPARPAAPPAPSVATTPSPHTPATSSALQPSRCSAAVPASWKLALETHTVSVSGKRFTPLAVDAAGRVIADQAADAAAPSSHQLVLITTGGTVRPLWSAAAPPSWNGMRLADASASGDWVAFAVLVGGRPTGGQGPTEIDLVNSRTHTARTLRPTFPGDATIVLGPVIAGGGVFWTLIDAGQGLSTGRVYRYDLGTGHTKVVDSGYVTAPQVIGGGIYWSKNGAAVTYRAGTLPPGYTVSPTGKNRALATDGTTYAWGGSTSSGDIETQAWRAGAPGPVRLGVPGDAVGVTGSFVWTSDGVVLDTRTGATVRISRSTDPPVAAGRTAAVPLAHGAIAVVDVSALPGLGC